MKIYTKTGDLGSTSLVTGQRVSKNDLRIEAYGVVDELNAVIGLVIEELKIAGFDLFAIERGWLQRIQTDLFALGSELSCFEGKVPKALQGVIVEDAEVQVLEQEIDSMSENLPALTNFVLPGGSKANALTHLARTVCRRSERLCVRLSQEDKVRPILVTYLNRLSDWCFALGRAVTNKLHSEEVLWKPRQR